MRWHAVGGQAAAVLVAAFAMHIALPRRAAARLRRCGGGFEPWPRRRRSAPSRGRRSTHRDRALARSRDPHRGARALRRRDESVRGLLSRPSPLGGAAPTGALGHRYHAHRGGELCVSRRMAAARSALRRRAAHRALGRVRPPRLLHRADHVARGERAALRAPRATPEAAHRFARREARVARHPRGGRGSRARQPPRDDHRRPRGARRVDRRGSLVEARRRAVRSSSTARATRARERHEHDCRGPHSLRTSARVTARRTAWGH